MAGEPQHPRQHPLALTLSSPPLVLLTGKRSSQPLGRGRPQAPASDAERDLVPQRSDASRLWKTTNSLCSTPCRTRPQATWIWLCSWVPSNVCLAVWWLSDPRRRLPTDAATSIEKRLKCAAFHVAKSTHQDPKFRADSWAIMLPANQEPFVVRRRYPCGVSSSIKADSCH